MRVSAASTWASSASSTNVTVNGESNDSVAPSFNVHRVSASHSYRSLTPLNMKPDLDLSDSQVSEVTSKLATCDETMKNVVLQLTPTETSLEMIKLSLTSSSDQSEDRNDQTEFADEITSANEATGFSLSDSTLGPEVPSLPTDQYDQSEPVSLSQIELEERIEH